jgi:E3 SUMO-protein ligase PIAS1
MLDNYMLYILQSTSEETEEVTIEPDGEWHLGKGSTTPAPRSEVHANPTPPDDGDSDDVLEIIENPTMGSLRQDWRPAALTPSSVRTPPLNHSRAPSATPVSATRGQKRLVSEVIDLTFSDEEEDDQPPVKRQRPSMSSSTNSFRARPPDPNRTGTPVGGYSFQMPPPNPPMGFDFDDRYGGSSY